MTGYLKEPLRRGRPQAKAQALLRFDDGLTIDPARRSVTCQGKAVELTSTEFDLLLLLAGHPNQVFDRDQILNQLRGQDAFDLHSRAVDILVSRLRRKLMPLQPIKTLRNAGYVFAGVRQ